MVVEFCQVRFLNNPNKVFYSGQTLSGVVEIELKEKMKVKSECFWWNFHEVMLDFICCRLITEIVFCFNLCLCQGRP
jgi:hypothetical protein